MKISKETSDIIFKFRDERNWKQFHNPKDLAISINIEASELLELFQWSGEKIECPEKKDRIAEELADVLSYCILMADACGLDPDKIIKDKFLQNAEKYPVDRSFGKSDKYCDI